MRLPRDKNKQHIITIKNKSKGSNYNPMGHSGSPEGHSGSVIHCAPTHSAPGVGLNENSHINPFTTIRGLASCHKISPK